MDQRKRKEEEDQREFQEVMLQNSPFPAPAQNRHPRAIPPLGLGPVGAPTPGKAQEGSQKVYPDVSQNLLSPNPTQN